MRPIPFRQLVLRCLAEYRAKGSIFDIAADHFWRPSAARRVSIFSSSAENPVGPAAGPHTQLAQNIVAAWLTGGRYFELKTVQKLDSLTIEKPCIDASDEGYNVEWSTELSLDQAYDEYLKAWMVLHVFDALVGASGMGAPPAGPSFLFNMSVGYDLEGIRTEKMDRFINRLIDSSSEALFLRYREELASLAEDPSLLAGTPWRDRTSQLRAVPAGVSPRICGSVTLSTMHGCPPGEIESICLYMLKQKKLDTLVKLNPTLLGYDRARETLSGLGWTTVTLSREGFQKDLQYSAAVPMLRRLQEAGRAEGRHFGAKLSNTLASANDKKVLPGAEMYMSGRALYPLTMSLAAALAADFEGDLPLSFSGGISAWNAAEVLSAGIRPLTLATDLLKPGGYGRLKEIAEITERHAESWSASRVDPLRTRTAAESSRAVEHFRKDFRGDDQVHVPGALPLFDCFVAPCLVTCPIHQDVPEYIHLAGEGRYEEAFDAIYARNPLPFITGYLCDHQCTENCTRMDWEGAVRIREMKRIAAERGYTPFRRSGTPNARKASARGIKAAIIGAGPAGLGASCFLAREGFEVHVFEKEHEPGGVVRYLLPGFRMPPDAVEKDVSLLRDQGVQFHFGERTIPAVRDLQAGGFRYVLAAVGAQGDRDLGIPGARPVLSFLREFRQDPSRLQLGSTVVVVGAGDTAMDAARAAKRCAGVKDVSIVYRRAERDMPASREEYESALREGIGFHFLRAPQAWVKGPGTGLVCTVMEQGAPDESGRSRPVPTRKAETLSADTLITAVGVDVEKDLLEALGIAAADAPSHPDPESQETGIAGVFLIGDAAQGAETIVKAIASARRAADAICAKEGGSKYRNGRLPAEDTVLLRSRRDRLAAASGPSAEDEQIRERESRRCLGCRALCMKCVEVCPNRANTMVRAANGFRDEWQIVHLDAFCNECGNCATFCPWDGRPYRDKLTIFAGAEDFHKSENPGFFLSGGKGLLRLGLAVRQFALDDAGNVPADIGDESVRSLMQTVVKHHSHLFV
ncbi:MAG TPA: putative selenate reductase subunit YgfK [Spirochaetia bacterium]|nr:putative selenate reductase subunit YgfK [Spirochaetia bacterium]